MCELLAMSASAPVDIRLSLGELARHGGETGIHTDGWGVAFLEGRDARIVRDPSAAASSPWIDFLARHPARSDTVVAHIRHAIHGAITLANTQPFARELWGRVHVFAHNGFFTGLEAGAGGATRFQPVGETDSEIAFCELLELFARRVDPEGRTAEEDMLRIFAEFAWQMRLSGPANIIYASNGRILAHADRRTQRPGVIAPPGLWVLERSCGSLATPELAASGVEVASETPLLVTLLASVPLTNEPWHPLKQGAVLDISGGIVRSLRDQP